MQEKQMRIIPGPYRKADPEWEMLFIKWIYKKDPNKSLAEIKSITQRDDQMGFRIDLMINNTINAFITFHCQVPKPFGISEAPFLIITSFSLPLREYFPIRFKHLNMTKDNIYQIYKNQKWTNNEIDPLIKCLKDIGFDPKKYGRVIKDSYSMYYGSGVGGIMREVSYDYRLFIVPSEEIGSMVLQNYAFIKLKMKKKKKKIVVLTNTSFLGIYEFLIPYYNKIISQLDNIKNYFINEISKE